MLEFGSRTFGGGNSGDSESVSKLLSYGCPPAALAAARPLPSPHQMRIIGIEPEMSLAPARREHLSS